eukprot:TRINITY_DN11177_c0_g3_i1.p1 TRINITY_DN11177_c0_g3~~TRINITY_DN11177_c0_g3_i1.p1  ORF type:complete len:1542 (-),score=309.17 TRINITY_DN11177_c0_g3_i1:132-4757(-)
MAAAAASLKGRDEVLAAVKDLLRRKSPRGSGVVSQNELRRLVNHFLPDEHGASIEHLLRRVNADANAGIQTDRFVDYLWSALPTPTAEAPSAEKEGLGLPESNGRWLAYALNAFGGVRFLSWNVMSSAFAQNPFEFKPAVGYLDKGEQETLDKLLALADEWICQEDKSPKLLELLGEDFLKDERVTAIEKEPITKLEAVEDEGLGTWLESRKDRWPQHWPRNTEEAKKLYLKSFEERWEFWKTQTVHEFICEDQSGGSANKRLPVKEPNFDACCWSLGIGMADRSLSDGPHRRKRAWWLALTQQSSGQVDDAIKGLGLHDFFKLLVFDFINIRMFETCGQAACEQLAKQLIPEDFRARMDSIASIVNGKADVAMLHEIPFTQELGMFSEHFYEIRHRPKEHERQPGDFGSAILVRKSKFVAPVEADCNKFVDETGNVNYRLVDCRLKLNVIADDVELHVIGLHLPGRGKRIEEHIAKQVEGAIRANTIAIAGDFNLDLRNNDKALKGMEAFPKFLKFLQQGKKQEKHLASTCKERMPFQAQVTKMFKKDVAMKDYMLWGDGFHGRFEVQGYVDEKTRLPSADVPSDHAPLIADLGNDQFMSSPGKSGQMHQKCICGNRFMHDSLFCRNCGRERRDPVFNPVQPSAHAATREEDDIQKWKIEVLEPFMKPIIETLTEAANQRKDVRIAAAKFLAGEMCVSLPEVANRTFSEIQNHSSAADLDFVETIMKPTKRAIQKKHCPEPLDNKKDFLHTAMEVVVDSLNTDTWTCRLCGKKENPIREQTCGSCGLPRDAGKDTVHKLLGNIQMGLKGGANKLMLTPFRGVICETDRVDLDTATKINEALNCNDTIEVIAFKAETDEACAAMLKGLGAHPTLKWFTITGCNAGAHTAKAIQDILRKSKTLTGFCANENNFDDSHVKFIAQGLGENHLVDQIQLNSNDIREEGATLIAQAVSSRRPLSNSQKKNALVLELQISDNEIGTGGLTALYECANLSVQTGTSAYLDSKEALKLLKQKEIIEAMRQQDYADTARILRQKVDEATKTAMNSEKAEQATQHQRALFEHILINLHGHDNKAEFVASVEKLTRIAKHEEERLINEVITKVMNEKYKASETRWAFAHKITQIARDPAQEQYCPAGLTDDTNYVDYILMHAQWAKPGFVQICESLALIFNGADTSEEICCLLNLPPEEFPLPLRSKALTLAADKNNNIVRLHIGPPKDKYRAKEKSAEKWLEQKSNPKGKHCLTDLVRATFEFGDPYVLSLMAHALEKNFLVTRLVNRLCDKEVRQPPNVNMNIEIDGFIVEVQLLLSDILKIKYSLHKYYQIKRGFALHESNIDMKEMYQLANPVFDVGEHDKEFITPRKAEEAVDVINKKRHKRPMSSPHTQAETYHEIPKKDGWYWMNDASVWQKHEDEIGLWLEAAVNFAQNDQLRMNNWLKRADDAPTMMRPAGDMRDGKYVPEQGPHTSFAYFSGIVHVSETHAVNIFEMKQSDKRDPSKTYPVIRIRHQEVVNDDWNPIEQVSFKTSQEPKTPRRFKEAQTFAF